MTHFNKTSRNTVKRAPKRAHYDQETVYRVLDAGFLCHVGMAIDGQPFVIPTLYGRKDDHIFLHGATTSRMLMHLEKGLPVCITVTHLDGLVLARSAFHHSANYRSVVVFGTARLVPEDQKMEALQIVSDQILQGRWEEVRPPNAKEMKATSVLAVKIENASAKIRTGGPADDAEDYDLPIWAGVVPLKLAPEYPVTDPAMRMQVEAPESVMDLVKRADIKVGKE